MTALGSLRLLVALAALALMLAACAQDGDAEGDDPAEASDPDASADTGDEAGTPAYEIWSADQGEDVHTIHVHDADLEEVAEIDLGGEADTPHMIDFDSQGRYAFVANTGSHDVAVIDAEAREVVELVDTGETAHMAAVAPDDSVWVANIGANSLTEIEADHDAGAFSAGREIDFDDDPLYQETFGDLDEPPGAVCHDYTADSAFAYVTFGPAEGGLGVVDLDAGELVAAFDPDEVRANCGTALSDDGSTMFANWGSPDQDEGEWYAFDVDTHELVHADGSGGVDAHGVRLHPDGDALWQVNRGTDDGQIIDPDTYEVVDELDFVGESPDIIDFSPDGDRLFVSLRGPEPQSGDPHVASGSTPGFAVIDVDQREVVEIVQPRADDDASDVHGLAVRALD